MANVASELQSLPFGSLIGGPLDAAIEAQARAAISSVGFIRTVGFDEKGEVQTITFKATRGDDEVAISVPLLTILPIPFIRIDDMTIDFKANITSTKESSDKTVDTRQYSAKAQASARYLFFKASLDAAVSNKRDSESTKNSKYAVETTMDIHVHAVQDEMPAGLSKMLEILTDTIQAPPPRAEGEVVTGGQGPAGKKD